MNANNIIKLSIGDFVKFGPTAQSAGAVVNMWQRKTREVVVKINDCQTAIVPTSSITEINCRRVGDNMLALTF